MKTNTIIPANKYVIKKGIVLLAGFILMTLSFVSCKKHKPYDGPLYSIKVFNAIDDGINVYRTYNGGRPASFRDAGLLSNRRAPINSDFVAETIIASYFASPDTLSKDQPILRQEFNLSASPVNTIYIMGNKASVDYLFTAPALKRYNDGDSVTYLTFVNICNDQPVSLNIKGKANGSLITQLPYKHVSELIELPVGLAIKNYDIEFRDAITGDSLTTFVINNSNPGLGYANTYLYKNASIVLMGKREQKTGLNKLEAIRVNHD